MCCQTVSRPRYTRTMCPLPLAFRGKAFCLHPQLRRYKTRVCNWTTTSILTSTYTVHWVRKSREQKNQQGTHDILLGIYLKIVFYPFSKDISISKQIISVQQFSSQNWPKSIFKTSSGISLNFKWVSKSDLLLFLLISITNNSRVFISKPKSTILYIKIIESGKPWFCGRFLEFFNQNFAKTLPFWNEKTPKWKIKI